jgi:hypothetical protein
MLGSSPVATQLWAFEGLSYLKLVTEIEVFITLITLGPLQV